MKDNTMFWCLCRASHADKDSSVIFASILDICASEGNYMWWSDGTHNIHTASARIHADLETLLEEFTRRRAKGKRQPRHCLIIEDNAPDHKNNNRMLFYALLVKEDVFHCVEFLYMPTGHTHWRIDQIFSVLARAVKKFKGGLLTFSDLERLLEKAYRDLKYHLPNIVKERHEIADLNTYLDEV